MPALSSICLADTTDLNLPQRLDVATLRALFVHLMPGTGKVRVQATSASAGRSSAPALGETARGTFLLAVGSRPLTCCFFKLVAAT